LVRDAFSCNTPRYVDDIGHAAGLMLPDVAMEYPTARVVRGKGDFHGRARRLSWPLRRV
jgi:hypothetical protein